MIDKEELTELMKDEKRAQDEEMRRDMDEEKEDNRTELEQGYHDSGMRPGDFM